MLRFVNVLSGILVFLLLLRCSLFEPRDDFEPPGKSDRIYNTSEDFNFNDILQCARNEYKDILIRFTYKDFNDIFSDGMVYSDVNAERDEYSKSALVNRLIMVDKPEIALWENGSCTRRGDTIFIQDINYKIKFSSEEISGTSDFYVVNSGEYWFILKWTNYPSVPYEPSMLTPVQE